MDNNDMISNLKCKGKVKRIFDEFMKGESFYMCHLYNYMHFFSFTANGIVKTDRVEEALRGVDRGQFCKNYPYKDSPQTIGFGVTISAPHMVREVFNLSILNLKGLTKYCNLDLYYRLYDSFGNTPLPFCY